MFPAVSLSMGSVFILLAFEIHLVSQDQGKQHFPGVFGAFHSLASEAFFQVVEYSCYIEALVQAGFDQAGVKVELPGDFGKDPLGVFAPSELGKADPGGVDSP